MKAHHALLSALLAAAVACGGQDDGKTRGNIAKAFENAADPEAALRSIYACYVLPAALAARFGFDALAFRLYRRMLTALSRAARTRI